MSIWEETHTPPERGGAVAPVPHAFGKEQPDPDGTPPGFDFSFFAGIGASLGSLADSLQRQQDRRDRLAGCAPQDYNPVVQGTLTTTTTASTSLVLDLGSVPEGRVWQVRRIVIGGPKATDTPPGKALVVAQGAAPTPAAIPTINVLDSFPSFALGAQGSTYGTHQLFLVAPEHLWVAVIVPEGTAAPYQWVVSARIEDFDAATYYEATSSLQE